MSTEEKFKMMTEKPVERLVISMAIPTIISMMITYIYNMADTFFVSKISTSASGAVGIAFALMAIIQAIGFTFGHGAGSYISRLLGQRKKKYAARVVATSFFTAFGLGVLLAILGTIFLDPLVYALGATKTIAPYAKDYIRYILIGMPFMITSFVLNQSLRFQGSAFYAMVGITFGGVLNIILDPIFIFTLNLGIAGAAIATILSQFLSFLILLHNSKIGGNIAIQFKNFNPLWKIYREILHRGLPSFYRQTLASTAMILLNFASGPYGDAAIAAISIVSRVSGFAVSTIMGFSQGFQPVCGFNYGAKYYGRMFKSYWFTVKTATVILTILGTISFIFAPNIISLFRKEDLEVITIGTRALRFYSLALPSAAMIIPSNMFLQIIAEGAEASLLAIARQGLFFIPIILILPRQFGLLGVQMSQPISDVFATLLAIVIMVKMLKELRQEEKQLQFKELPDFVAGVREANGITEPANSKSHSHAASK